MELLDSPDTHSHSVFSEEIIRFLMNYYGIEDYPEEEDCPFFTKDMGKAVVTISNIFQKEHSKTFYLLGESLKNVQRFEEYCLLISIEQDDRYFYNFLRRVSLIFELAMYCFQKKFPSEESHFSVACRCIGHYPDWKYFDGSGGWDGLKYTACFLANIGRPLKMIMKDNIQQDQNIQTFSDAVSKLREDYLYTANLNMLDSEEMLFLEDLSKLSKANSKDTVKKKRTCSSLRKHSPGKKANRKSEKEILMRYFECYLNTEKEHEVYTVLSTPSTLSVGIAKKSLSDTEKEGKEEDRDILREKFDRIEENSNLLARSSLQENGRSNSLLTPFQPTVTSAFPETDENLDSIKESGLAENMSNVQNTFSPSKNCAQKKRDSLCSEFELDDSPQVTLVSTSPKTRKQIKTKGEASYSKSEKSEIKSAFEELFDYSKGTNKSECAGASEGKKIKQNFIIPEKYLKTDQVDCKYLYSAKVDPPSNKSKMTKSLKKILDTNIHRKNYRLMTSGDIFVSSPGSSSQEEETLYVFVDSSSDEEGDKDINRIICLFKKCDLDFESKKDEIYKLRPRKPSIQRKYNCRNKLSVKDAVHKESKAFCGEPFQKLGLGSKHGIATDTDSYRATHVKYLTRLYKKYLPQALEECMNTYKSELFQNESNINAETASPHSNKNSKDSSPIHVVKTSTIFVITAGLLARRKLDLQENEETDDILGELETSFQFNNFNPLTLLHENKDLNAYIKCGKYKEIYPGVFMVGEFSSETENWFLFDPLKSNLCLEEHRREMLRVTRMYKEAVQNCPEFTNVTTSFLTCIEKALLRLLREI